MITNRFVAFILDRSCLQNTFHQLKRLLYYPELHVLESNRIRKIGVFGFRHLFAVKTNFNYKFLLIDAEYRLLSIQFQILSIALVSCLCLLAPLQFLFLRSYNRFAASREFLRLLGIETYDGSTAFDAIFLHFQRKRILSGLSAKLHFLKISAPKSKNIVSNFLLPFHTVARDMLDTTVRGFHHRLIQIWPIILAMSPLQQAISSLSFNVDGGGIEEHLQQRSKNITFTSNQLFLYVIFGSVSGRSGCIAAAGWMSALLTQPDQRSVQLMNIDSLSSFYIKLLILFPCRLIGARNYQTVQYRQEDAFFYIEGNTPRGKQSLGYFRNVKIVQQSLKDKRRATDNHITVCILACLYCLEHWLSGG